MGWSTILDGFFWIMGVISGGFLAWGGWRCLRDLAADHARLQLRKTRARMHLPRGARLS
jgi:hypothetical protein